MLKRGLLGGAAVAAALLAGVQAQAAPVTATIRVEGVDHGVIPQTTLQIDGRSVTDNTGAQHPLPEPRALGLLYSAAEANSVPIDCTWNDAFGGDCSPLGIGGERPTGDGYWALVVNDRYASLGAGSQPVASGDRVVFLAIADYHLPVPPLLELSLSGDKLTVGSSFTVTVTSFDVETGAGTPVSGARVAYGSQVSGTDAEGHATLFAQLGTVAVSATKDGAVPVSAAPICAYADDPTVCKLPPAPVAPVAPTPVTPAPVVSQAADSVPPASRITMPKLFSIDRHVTRIGGVVAPDRSDIAKVEFALARRVGTLCRFRQPSGSFGGAIACSRPAWLPARGGAFWTASLHTPLAAGRYRVFARATDGAGNVERTLVTGASSGSFTVR